MGFPTSTDPFAADALGGLYSFLIVEAFIFAALTCPYFDRTVAHASDELADTSHDPCLRRLFFQYFASSSAMRMAYDRCMGCGSSAAPSANDAAGVLEDDDVEAERDAVDALTASGGYQPGGPALIIEHLRKQFSGKGGKLAVRDLCVRIDAGEVFGFLGTNGAGKSTTFGMLTGEKVPSVRPSHYSTQGACHDTSVHRCRRRATHTYLASPSSRSRARSAASSATARSTMPSRA